MCRHHPESEDLSSPGCPRSQALPDGQKASFKPHIFYFLTVLLVVKNLASSKLKLKSLKNKVSDETLRDTIKFMSRNDFHGLLQPWEIALKQAPKDIKLNCSL